MINDLLPRLTTKLDSVKSTGISCHVHSLAFISIERELLLGGKYFNKVPKGFPCDNAEQKGFRKLLQPSDGIYQNMKLRIGKSTLHIADKENKKNLEAIALLYFGSVKTEKIGVIIGHSLEGYGGIPYPRTRFDVKEVFEITAHASGFIPEEVFRSREFKSIPDLVMLCVESYRGK